MKPGRRPTAARLRGWKPRGERLVDKVPQGKWKTATFLAALRNDRIDAPCLFDGPITKLPSVARRSAVRVRASSKRVSLMTRVASGSCDNAMDEIPGFIPQIRPRADKMREREVQRKHLLVTATIEMTACRVVLDGVNDLIKIGVVIAVARMLTFDFGLAMRKRGLDRLKIAVRTREGEASNARRVVFAVYAAQRTQDASDVG